MPQRQSAGFWHGEAECYSSLLQTRTSVAVESESVFFNAAYSKSGIWLPRIGGCGLGNVGVCRRRPGPSQMKPLMLSFQNNRCDEDVG